MKTVLLYNLGTSEFNSGNDNFTKLTADSPESELLEPVILGPMLAELQSRSGLPDSIRIFYTDQSDECDDPKRARQDTRDIYQRMKGHLISRGLSVFGSGINRRPHSYDDMLHYYDEYFAAHWTELSAFDRIYVAVTSGTQQMNFALLFCSILNFENRIYPIVKDRYAAHAEIIEIRDSFLEKMLRSNIKKLMAQGYFHMAGRIIGGLPQIKWNPSEIAYIKARELRDLFDFPAALAVLRPLRYSCDARYAELIEKEIQELTVLDIEPYDNRLTAFAYLDELFDAIKVRMRRQDYAEGIARLYRFVDFVTQIFLDILNIIPLSLNKDSHAATGHFTRFVNDHSTWKNEFEKSGIRPEPSIVAVKFLCGLLNADSEMRNTYPRLPDFKKKTYDQVYKIVDNLRHKSIYGHGFKPLTENEFRNENTDPDTLLVTLTEIISMVKNSFK